MARAKNVLWITVDEMRTSAVSVFGNPYTKMPALERLASEGAAFSKAFCNMPKCVPSRCSMMTGRYPHVDGYRTLHGRTGTPPHAHVKNNTMVCLQEDTPNLVTEFRERGRKTCLLGKNHLVEWNLHEKWFDKTPSWDFERRPRYDDVDPRLLRADYAGKIPDDYDMERHEDAVAAREVVEFFEECGDEPFFALIDIGKPHPKYEDYPYPASNIPLEQIDGPPWTPLEQEPSKVMRLNRTSKGLEHLTSTDRKRVHRAYLSMCEFADAMVGRILDGLDRLGLTEDTLVIVNADHGDFAAERNGYEKWDTAMFDSITNVPLFVRGPGVQPGVHSDTLVELVDLAPTICDAVGIDTPRWIQGKSLMPILSGAETRHKSAVFSQGGVEHDLTLRPTDGTSVKQQVLKDFPETMERCHMVRTERHKLVFRVTGDHELYDLELDPNEQENRIDCSDYVGIRSELMERLVKFFAESATTDPEVTGLTA